MIRFRIKDLLRFCEHAVIKVGLYDGRMRV